MAAAVVKQEAVLRPNNGSAPAGGPTVVIELSSSSGSDTDVEDGDDAGSGPGKRPRDSGAGEGSGKGEMLKKHRASGPFPRGFIETRPTEAGAVTPPPIPPRISVSGPRRSPAVIGGNKQFWKAGDYDGAPVVDASPLNGMGMDHLRVHPKFLHSNATSHKWALGAFAELLDNALDEGCHGATFVNIDVLQNMKDKTRMLLIEDNGGGMDPDKMRQCMSLGYSAKSKIANTIGQYGNGFKTSTMRLGADVIVFSRSHGNDGKSLTQSIGMLSYTFLRNTGKEDIIVPMLDYEKTGHVWHRMTRSSSVDWNVNVETIVQWSPYLSEADLLKQLNSMSDHGTRIVIYNLWEDDQGALELDFDTDGLDIQLGGVNRDDKKIEMATAFPNSRHFLTYRHSLRSYASILYLRLPRSFRMILRGKEVEHHNLVNDMMLKDTVYYRPQPGADGVLKDPNVVAVVTIGFVKDAKHHIDVQGFNVYHKNRLIKPFWRVWNAAGSDGRGAIGVLEANFVEPAHDKQGFERTNVLSRLETRLVQIQKTYWSINCHKIGYAPRRNMKQIQAEVKESSPEAPTASRPCGKDVVSRSQGPTRVTYSDRYFSCSKKTGKLGASPFGSDKSWGSLPFSKECRYNGTDKFEKCKASRQSRQNVLQLSDESDSETEYHPTGRSRPSLLRSLLSVNKGADVNYTPDGIESTWVASRSQSKAAAIPCNGNETSHEDSQLKIKQLKDENDKLKIRIKDIEETMSRELQLEREKNKLLTDQAASSPCNGNEISRDDSQLRIKQLKVENDNLKERIKDIEETMSRELQLEREKNKLLTDQLEATKKRLQEATKEHEDLVHIFADERIRRVRDDDNLRKNLRDASLAIQELLEQRNASQSNQ